MHRVWTFSTLQRPTHEDRERRRKFRGEDSSKPNSKNENHTKSLLRSKTFRHNNGSASETNLELLNMLQQQQQHQNRGQSRSKSSTREYSEKKSSSSSNANPSHNSGKGPSNPNNGFVSRLRFHEEPQKLRWQDREPATLTKDSSGYSSGGQSKDENIYGESHGLDGGEMVSRRKILSRSRDDLNLDGGTAIPEPDEEDVWYQKEKLYKDHIQEVLNKWESIDDEIWAKIIVLERNRRVAKAYARAPVLTVNGSDDGFDGFKIGLGGFDNPMRDPKTEEVKRNIGQGCKIKMDDSGNILVKRIAKANVYVKCISDENSIANEILKLPNGSLESDKPVKLFDMKKFQQNLNKELKRSYPDRRKLECQCISSIAFVKNEGELLDSPCWIMLINVVAMDMLKSKIPPVRSNNTRSAIDIRNRPRIPIPDEDPYSVAGSGSSGSSGNGNRERSRDKPPKLPPRDLSRDIYAGFGKGEYPEHIDELRFRQMQENRRRQNKKSEKKGGDDPYYSGLRARIPNFAKPRNVREKEAAMNRYNPNNLAPNPANAPMGPLYAPLRGPPGVNNGGPYGSRPPPGMVGNIMAGRPFDRNPTTWVPSAPIRNDYESDYSHIYGRLPFPNRGLRGILPPPPPPPGHPANGHHRHPMYVSEWE